MHIRDAIEAKKEQWSREAEVAVAQCGKSGSPLVTQCWANGQEMVGPKNGLASQFIPLTRAMAIRDAGWTINASRGH